MIEPDGQYALAPLLAALKRQNLVYYHQILEALQKCVDPEHKRFLAAPADGILHQQGRTAFAVEFLELVVRCEEIAEARSRAVNGAHDGRTMHG